ncbi:hypothetical protein T06_7494 [Trichinella sp. T6]|nr:hypothetical protein T06_7494 [Trichinella sp. T6]
MGTEVGPSGTIPLILIVETIKAAHVLADYFEQQGAQVRLQ